MSAEIIHGDCLDVMRGMAAASVDAVVTDPPYGLSFMGKDWDHGVPGEAFWSEALRVSKPGARILAFGGTRTFHRLAVAIEDAGWEIEDCLSWLYGSGFPKHASKLKPAWEPIILARKPDRYATPLNIDECRLACVPGDIGNRIDPPGKPAQRPVNHMNDDGSFAKARNYQEPSGRWPANVVLDEDAAGMLDEQSGTLPARHGPVTDYAYAVPNRTAYSGDNRVQPTFGYGDTGGASRFYYCAKASRSEREAGLEGEYRLRADVMSMNAHDHTGGIDGHGKPYKIAPVRNNHPTVKPVSLMRWLVRLVTPQGGTVLDPFAGSFTTGIACELEGFHSVLIEKSAEYVGIGRARLAHWSAQPSLGVAYA